MLALGKWEISVNHALFKGKGIVEISERNGNYECKPFLPEKYKNVKIKTYGIKQVSEDTLIGKGEVSLLPGRTVTVKAKVSGNFLRGTANIPIMGNMTVSFTGRKIG